MTDPCYGQLNTAAHDTIGDAAAAGGGGGTRCHSFGSTAQFDVRADFLAPGYTAISIHPSRLTTALSLD